MTRQDDAASNRQVGAFARYAVNVGDLTRFARPDAPLADRMVMTLLTRRTVECEDDRWDGDALLVREDVSAERMRAVLTVLRTRLRVAGTDLRIYGAPSACSRRWTRLADRGASRAREDEDGEDEDEEDDGD